MRETVNSLKTYFFVVAVLNLIGSLATPIAAAEEPLLLVFGAIGFGFAIAYFYLRFNLRRLLVHSPNVINGVIYANAGYQVLLFALGFFADPPFTQGIPRLAIGLAIAAYLLHSVKRLSQEERDKKAAHSETAS